MKDLINPWGSKSVKDYDRLISDFGIQKIDGIIGKLPKKHHFFTRKIIFGHKSFQTILDSIKKKKKFVLMTGLMPSGNFHLGHKMIVDEILYFQSLGAECYIAVADIESYLTRDISIEEARKVAINQYLLNYIALGLNPKKTKFYFQSEGSKDYMNLSKFVAKRTTFNELKNIYGDVNPNKVVSALTQMADILHPQLKENGDPKPVIVPVGVDQLPHINLCRDLASKMKEFKFISPSAIFHKLMPGLKGVDTKMSSSVPESAIFLTDSPKEVESKVKKYAFSGGKDTLKEHREKGGNPDIDVSYQWLTFLEEDDKKLKSIYDDYKSGSMLSSELKQILIDKLNSFLKEHQKKREKAKKEINKFIL